MQRTISSAHTYVMKVIFPVIWIGAFVIATLQLFLRAGGITDQYGNPPSSDMKWTFLFATLAGSAFIYWVGIRLKRVAIDDKALYVSNYRREIVVPLRDIEEVTEIRWINIHPVTIHFFRGTEFGNNIVFMPKVRWLAFCSSHPIVAEIRSAAARARGAATDAPAA
jgi:hypothetical protein